MLSLLTLLLNPNQLVARFFKNALWCSLLQNCQSSDFDGKTEQYRAVTRQLSLPLLA